MCVPKYCLHDGIKDILIGCAIHVRTARFFFFFFFAYSTASVKYIVYLSYSLFGIHLHLHLRLKSILIVSDIKV